MNLIVHALSGLGFYALAATIVVASVAGVALASAWFGTMLSSALLNGREDPGLSKGMFWGAVAGFLLSLYWIIAFGLGTAFLAILGLCVALFVAGLVTMPFAGGSPAADGSDFQYPY